MSASTQLTNNENRKWTNMKLQFISTVVFVLMLVVASSAYAKQSAGVLFQSGLYQEQVKGDLDAAIKIYERVLKDFPKDRPVAAKAQLHIGLCYEKLGLKEAQRAYQKVVDSYPEQAEAVKLANEKLSLLLRAEAVIRKEDKEFNIRQVWAGPDVDIFGAPSPDGRYLSYVDWDTGDLAIYEISTGKKRRLTNKGSWEESDEYAIFSRWSPDGKQIVYQWYNESEKFVELRIIGLDGSKPRILYSNEDEYAETYDWSTDGKQILVFLDGSDQIVSVSAADGSVRVIKILEQGDPKNMSFSPDGRYIVYDFPQKEDSPEHDISLLSTNGSREISLVEHPANDFVLGWAPDGKQILFASDRTGILDAWVIQVADGKPQGAPELVKPDMIVRRFQPMGFTRDGSFYYGCGAGSMSDVYIAKLDPETGKILVLPKKTIKRFEGSNRQPRYSPDGKYLAYISIRGTKAFASAHPNVLCIHSLETGEERELLPKLKRIDFPRWSPDCNSIIVGGLDNNNNNSWGIYQIDTQTGNVKLLVPTLEDSQLYTHEWSRDGKAFFYGRRSKTDDLSQIMLREIESGAEKELYRASYDVRFYLSCSPDGKWLAFINRSNKKVLRIMPAAGGEPRELCTWDREPLPDGPPIWTADGRYILFVSRYSEKEGEATICKLLRIPVEGGEPQKLGPMKILIHNMSFHPDGQHITFFTTTSRPEVWVMENFLPKSTTSK